MAPGALPSRMVTDPLHRPGCDDDPEREHLLDMGMVLAPVPPACRNDPLSRLSRRRFLGGAGAALVAGTPGLAEASSQLLCPPRVRDFMRGGNVGNMDGAFDDSAPSTDFSDAIPGDGPGSRHLRVVRAQSGERFDFEYIQNGSYNPAAVQAWNRICRDGAGGETNMDPKTMDVLWHIMRSFGDTPLRMNSAYRSPEYNRKIGGAPNSQHMYGRAIDLAHPNRTPREVAAAARNAPGIGGVGLYRSFVHIDTGPRRFWTGT